MIRFVKSQSPDLGIKEMSEYLISRLNRSKDFSSSKTMLEVPVCEHDRHHELAWFLSGGSNLPISAEILKIIKASVHPAKIKRNLYVTLSDERYGPVGHKDSNWKGLAAAGFDFEAVDSVPVLAGQSWEETIDQFGRNVEQILENTSTIVMQFGMGADGHIAGILPDSLAVEDQGSVSGYHAEKYDRITLCPRTILRADRIFVFAFGETKRRAVLELQSHTSWFGSHDASVLGRPDRDLVRSLPVLALAEAADVSFYTDQI